VWVCKLLVGAGHGEKQRRSPEVAWQGGVISTGKNSPMRIAELEPESLADAVLQVGPAPLVRLKW